MSFDPLNFNEFALWLVSVRTDEASLRSAISRVYYSGHLLAVQRLMEKGWEPTGRGEDHGKVIFELKKRNKRNLSDALFALREFREHADYHREALESVLNRNCPHCEIARRAPSPDPNVTAAQWESAKQVGARLLPLLSRF
jgi:hypothetical protein